MTTQLNAMKQWLKALDNSVVVPSMFSTWSKYKVALDNKVQAIITLRTAIVEFLK